MTDYATAEARMKQRMKEGGKGKGNGQGGPGEGAGSARSDQAKRRAAMTSQRGFMGCNGKMRRHSGDFGTDAKPGRAWRAD